MFVNPYSHRVWPKDLNEYGVSPEEKEKFDRFLDDLSSGPAYGDEEFLKQAHLLHKKYELTIYPFFSHRKEENGVSSGLASISIDARKLLGPVSSQTYKLFNLTWGFPFVKKNIKNSNERAMLEMLASKTVEGIHQVYAVSFDFSLVKVYREDLCEYCERGHSFLRTSKIISDLIQGLGYLHGLKITQPDGVSHKVFHADLKPKNIFLDDSGAVIGDFGLINSTSGICGTPFYMPPEKLSLYMAKAQAHSPEVIAHNRQYGQQADIWALGLIFSGLLGGFNDSGYTEMPLLVKSFYDRFRIDSAESRYKKEYAFLAQWFKVSAKQIQDEWLQVSVAKALSYGVSTESILFSQLTVPRMLNPDPDQRLASALELKPFLNLLGF